MFELLLMQSVAGIASDNGCDCQAVTTALVAIFSHSLVQTMLSLTLLHNSLGCQSYALGWILEAKVIYGMEKFFFFWSVQKEIKEDIWQKISLTCLVGKVRILQAYILGVHTWSHLHPLYLCTWYAWYIISHEPVREYKQCSPAWRKLFQKAQHEYVCRVTQ